MDPERTTTRLRAIWAEILNVSSVQDEDHFLDLGGDSIAAVLCVTRIQAELEIEIPVATLFLEETTLRSLVAAIEAAARGEPASDEAPV